MVTTATETSETRGTTENGRGYIGDVGDEVAAVIAEDRRPGQDPPPDFAVFDCETAPLPDDQLRTLYREPTYEEFAAACDARWKEETKREKYRDAIVTGWDKFVDRAALDPATGRVVAIGFCYSNRDWNTVDCDVNEKYGLREFWEHLSALLAQQCPLVGFNIHAFDLPFLVRRSWILDVPVPAGVRQGRCWNPLFIDLMKVWQLDNYRDYISLDNLAKAFGLPGKVTEVDGVPIEGATFYKFWRENRPVAEAYLRRDLELPAILATKMGVV